MDSIHDRIVNRMTSSINARFKSITECNDINEASSINKTLRAEIELTSSAINDIIDYHKKEIIRLVGITNDHKEQLFNYENVNIDLINKMIRSEKHIESLQS